MEQKKKALGRGLEQLFDTEVLDFDSFESNILDSTKESDIKEIPLDEIRSNPYQPRKTFDQNALEELAESIKNYGVFQPIIVKKSIKGYDLVAGERRVKASRLAGMKTIPAIVKDFSDEMMREIALLENLQRENLTSIELAWAYKGIIDTLHIRQEDLAVKLGKSRSHITNTLGLLRLPESVQNMVLNGSISMAHARELSKIEDDNLICEYADKIVNNNIPVDFNNYKIVQISDFHNNQSNTLTNDLIKEIEKQKPNIIVVTGDFIDSNKTNVEVAMNFIKKINAVAPIYYVSGNHEASVKSYTKIKEQLAENKVVILENKKEELKINESSINLIGIDDPRMAHESFISDSEIVKVELDNTKYNGDKYNILLSHRPELFDTYVEKKIDLILTGHAHGGQIRIPFIGGIIAPNQGFFPKYTSGVIEKNKTTMVVSRGIGNSIIPLRINNRPELVVITLCNK